jgi:YD repeat-containing protein
VTTNGTAQARTHNAQNEVLTVAGATSPVYDANGNLTQDEAGKRYEYDGWNRPVRVEDAAGTTTLASYAYDGASHWRR